MYQYDAYDQKIVEERARQFKGQVERRLSGETTENEFKPVRLQNGLYMQLHAYMFRIAVPYGLLSSRQVRKLAHIARTYDKGYGHLTTRQNMQLNWPALESIPTMLEELASVQMHAVQTSGNCVRNTTSDPFAGVAPDELEDPRPYCELIRQWSTFHPEFAHLPRKFKIAVTGTPDHDRAAVRYHDIGIRIVQNAAGERGFEIWAGGGLGRTPVIGKAIRSFLEYEHLLSYIEAILRVYNLYGRRDNKFKARIKILVNEMTPAKFIDAVEAEWALIKDSALRLTRAELERIAQQFAPPAYEALGPVDLRGTQLGKDRPYARWLKQNVLAHKVPGYQIVVLTMKEPNNPPGDVSDTQLDAVADLADEFSFGQVVITHTQNMVLQHVKAVDLPRLHERLVALGMATPNYSLLTDIICCPGLDYCALANARAIPVALELNRRFDDLDYLHDIGPCSIKISGCINACGHHHIGNIGILGINKQGEEAYQLTLGGNDSDSASIGRILGPAFDEQGVVDAVQKVIEVYLGARASEEETFLECYRRVGEKPFKERVYASN
ncbi:MAG TPA: nitrite/sulfite reductase [Polyangiaceae bacterium]|nr:nitrite/sulfite reductase [Polyangiaceae bacterium]